MPKSRVRSIEVDGETVWIRPLTLGEWIKLDEFADDTRLQVRFVVACGSVTEDGQPVHQSPQSASIDAIEIPTALEIHKAVLELSNTGTLAAIEKNSAASP